jgi:hypothetical protein
MKMSCPTELAPLTTTAGPAGPSLVRATSAA